MRPLKDWLERNRVYVGVYEGAMNDYSRQSFCRGITIRNISFYTDLRMDDIPVNSDIDHLILKAHKCGSKYALLVAIGSYIFNERSIVRGFEREITRDFFILGHVLDRKEGYFSIHPQFLLLNLECWSEIGKPKFGSPNKGPLRLKNVVRSNENFHDDYTPVWIEAGDGSSLFKNVQDGWSLINCGISNSKQIIPFNNHIRTGKAYLYPELKDEFLIKRFDLWHKGNSWVTRPWYINNEKLTPDTELPKEKIKTFFALASGFKSNVILENQGFYESTEIFFYDSSLVTLNLKRWLIENWNGRDYVSVLNKWLDQSNDKSDRKEIFNDEFFLNLKAVLDHFGGNEGFAEHWTRFKNLRHSFLHINVFDSSFKTILGMIPDERETFIWWSNVFRSFYTQCFLTNEEVKSIYNFWIESLRRKSENLIVYGYDIYGLEVCGKIQNVEFKI
jgi:hypothetical protein